MGPVRHCFAQNLLMVPFISRIKSKCFNLALFRPNCTFLWHLSCCLVIVGCHYSPRHFVPCSQLTLGKCRHCCGLFQRLPIALQGGKSPSCRLSLHIPLLGLPAFDFLPSSDIHWDPDSVCFYVIFSLSFYILSSESSSQLNQFVALKSRQIQDMFKPHGISKNDLEGAIV